jgi:hypothetical protein
MSCHGAPSRAPRVVGALLATLTGAGAVSACGPRSAAPAKLTPRATVQRFNADLAQHDFAAACGLVRPFARPLLTDLREGHSLAACVAGLNARGAPALIAHYRLSAAMIRTASVSTIGAGTVSLVPAGVPDPVYLLNRVDGRWLIAGL